MTRIGLIICSGFEWMRGLVLRLTSVDGNMNNSIWKECVIKGCLGLVALLVSLLLPIVAQAGQARYVYDELGRLVRVMNEQGDVAIYNYDSVGNLLSIQRTTSANLAPVIDSITPNSFNRGTQTNITLTGQYFLSGVLTTNHPDITVSNVTVTDSTVTAMFTTALNAATGTFQATLTTHFGSASIPITVSQQSVAPSNLTAQEGNQQVILDWDDYIYPNFEGFHVYRGTASGGPYTRLTSSLITTSYYRDQTVTNGVAYYYVVTATQTGFSESAYSNEAQATPQGGPTTVCGAITTSTTWRLTGSPFQVTCDVTIQNNAVLTVEPGVEVRFASGTGLNIGVSVAGGAGGLSAVGSVAGPILFTSAQPTPAPGNWKGLNFTSNTIDASTRLDRVTVEYGGSGTNNANIRLDNAIITIQRSTIRYSSGHGIRLQTASGLTLNQSTIIQNASYGLIQEVATSLLVTITESILQNNGSYPVRLGTNSVAQLSGNTYIGNNPNAIEVIGGSVNSSQTWRNQGVPYIIITADITVFNLATLTLEPGVELRFSSGRGMIVGIPEVSNGSGTLSALGTAVAPIVFTSAQATPAPGDWKGLAFRNTALSANAQLDHVVVEYGGGGTYNTNIDIDMSISPARVSIQRSTIRHSSGHGILLHGVQIGTFTPVFDQLVISENAGYGLKQDTIAGLVTLTGSTIQNNGSYPVKVRADTVRLLSGNTYGGNSPDAIEVVGQAVTTTQTWQNEGVPYVIATGDITLQNGAVLTLELGQQVRFATGIGLNVGAAVSGGTGGLSAVGTLAAPIVFTSARTTPATGDWDGLNFTGNTIVASTRLDYVTVEYGGAGANNANILINNADMTIQHSTIRQSSGHGIRIQSAADPVIDQVTVNQNAGYGIIHEGTSGSLTLTGSILQNNGLYPVKVRASSIGRLSNNTYGGNTLNAIEVAGEFVNTSQTWRNEGVPLVITGDMTIYNNAVLTLEPGLQLRFASGSGLVIGYPVSNGSGGLSVVGTATAPIVFTSAQTTPAPGDWEGLNFIANTIDASTRLDYVIVEYGGAGTNNSNIRIDNANFPIQHSTIRNSSGYGIRLSSSNPTVNFNSITGNPLYGLFNATSTITINAENNWWGDPSGPTHASNPGGTGNAVSDFVDFTPWLTSPP